MQTYELVQCCQTCFWNRVTWTFYDFCHQNHRNSLWWKTSGSSVSLKLTCSAVVLLGRALKRNESTVNLYPGCTLGPSDILAFAVALQQRGALTAPFLILE